MRLGNIHAIMGVMSPISIKDKKETDSGWNFVVETPAGTTHAVTLSRDYYEELTGGSTTPEKLVWASLSFLIRHESSEKIMQEFDISDIPNYFPTYIDRISDTLSTLDE